MVKGISRQVIVVHPTDKSLFDQAIFILSDEAISGQGITEERLLREAKKYIQPQKNRKSSFLCPQCIAGLGIGSAITGLVWLLSAML